MNLRTSLALVLSVGLARLTAAETRPAETVGTLDFFGLRSVFEADIRAALKLKEGDPYDR